MKATTTKLLTAVLITATFSLNSCKKEETLVKTNTTSKPHSSDLISKRQMEANVATMKLSSFLQNLLASSTRYMKTDDFIEGFGCATVTVDSSSSPRIATFDFGSGCTDANGKFYSGSIVIQYTSPDLSAVNSQMNCTLNNFTADTVTYNGTFDYTNTGPSGLGHPTGAINVNMSTNFVHDNLTLTGNNTISFEWQSSRNTAYVTISGTGTDNNGISFSQNTNAPLGLKDIDGCREHFSSGVLYIIFPAFPGQEQEIDYGTGTCDDQATMSIGGGPATPFTLQ